MCCVNIHTKRQNVTFSLARFMLDENSPALPDRNRRVREDALHLGPRKKACVKFTVLYFSKPFSDVTLILSCLTDVTFVEQSMRYAT